MKTIRKRYCLTILLAVFFTTGILRATKESSGKDRYLKDFDFFIQTLVETHPDPFSAFGSRDALYRAKKELEKTIGDVSNDEEFAVVLNGFVSRLKDGHTFINYQRDKNDKNGLKKLPLRLKVAADAIFIGDSTKKYRNLIGKKILAVNGIPIKKLLVKASSLRPAENAAGAYYNLIRLLESGGSAKRLTGSGDALTFTLGETGKKKDVTVRLEPQVQFLQRTSKLKFQNDNGLLFWQMIGKDKDIGYFCWNSIVSREVVEHSSRRGPVAAEGMLRWAYSLSKSPQTGNVEQDIRQIPALYEQFYLLIQKMKEKKSGCLIIDLRRNNGGMTPLVEPILFLLYGDHYLNFRFNARYNTRLSPLYLKKIGFKSIEDYNARMKSHFRIGDTRFSGFGGMGNQMSLEEKRAKVKSGYFGLGAEFIQKAASGSAFRPKIIVLTSPDTYSAAFHFTWFLTRLGRTTVIGVASRQAGNSFMETTPFRLPCTGLSGSISNSVQVLYPGGPEQGRKLKPDVEMNWKDYLRYNFDKHSEVLKAVDMIEIVNKKTP